MIKEMYYSWKARRELKKACKVIKKICDEAPASFFKGMLYANGRELDHIECRNSLLTAVHRMQADLR